MRRVEWAESAVLELKEILVFWKNHNLSNAYSVKIQKNIINAEDNLKLFPFIGKETNVQGVYRLIILRRFAILYRIDEKKIKILGFKDLIVF